MDENKRRLGYDVDMKNFKEIAVCPNVIAK